jgi:hypothetical protein
MDFMHKNDYQDLDDYASRIGGIYCQLLKKHPSKVTTEDFLKEIRNVKTTFFKVNKTSKQSFVQPLLSQLSKIDSGLYTEVTGFDVAKNFVTKYFETGYDRSEFIEERNQIIARFGGVKDPHSKLLNAIETLLQKIAQSFQITLHGTKEYSGVDICKQIEGSTIGFQIKSINDDVSEDKVRSQTSKALEYCLDGFVWIYGRAATKSVESSMQAAYHYFKRTNQDRKMFCALIPPELLSELFRKYQISLE